jgi:hypothetical protein
MRDISYLFCITTVMIEKRNSIHDDKRCVAREELMALFKAYMTSAQRAQGTAQREVP